MIKFLKRLLALIKKRTEKKKEHRVCLSCGKLSIHTITVEKDGYSTRCKTCNHRVLYPYTITSSLDKR